MATSSKIHLSTSHYPEYYTTLKEDSSKKTSELLQENHEQHHIFFNASGFHNHIVHHLLTLYAVNASPSVLQKQYEGNKYYQRPPFTKDRPIQDMSDPTNFKKYFNNQKYYYDYQVFFQKQVDDRGWENVVNEYLFKGDERAEDILVRLFGGFLHPLIHLGFGVEFAQPAIVVEALAQTACHSDYMGTFLLGAEKAASEVRKTQKKSKTLVQILDEIRADAALSSAAHWNDDNKIRDGIIAREGEKMIKYASQYFISPDDDLDEKVAEMTNACVYYTGGAQHPPKLVKFDFYYMHCVNSAIFFSAFSKQNWLSKENKIRLLEWKGRNDLAMYASRRSPKILLDEIENYKPKNAGSQDSWQGIFERVKAFDDDGHAAKLVRALAHGQQICKKYENGEGFKIKGKMWDNLGHMAIDSVEADGVHWVRSAGFEEAWEDFGDRPKASL